MSPVALGQSIEVRRQKLKEHRDFLITAIPAVLDRISIEGRTAEQAKAVEWEASPAIRKRLENTLPGLIVHSFGYDADQACIKATVHWSPFALVGYPPEEAIDERAECDFRFYKNPTGVGRIEWTWKTGNLLNL